MGAARKEIKGLAIAGRGVGPGDGVDRWLRAGRDLVLGHWWSFKDVGYGWWGWRDVQKMDSENRSGQIDSRNRTDDKGANDRGPKKTMLM
ncbi:hypothetical protein ACH5RR_040845 [Cinchona calisaya]|uniref:Uncharacterized protein n=1 Tax=Cinchona calisaya TaxID=153742 RepID=A0ABD2XTG3_9GENT